MMEGMYPEFEASYLIGKITSTLDILFAHYKYLLSQDLVLSLHGKGESSKDNGKRQDWMDGMYDDVQESEEAVVIKSEYMEKEF